MKRRVLLRFSYRLWSIDEKDMTAPRILVVDDDASLRNLLERYLSENGFLTDSAAHAIDMQKLVQRETYQLYILDINLPHENGLQICQRLRVSGDHTPIIMLTARGEEIDRIIGLELGADDYLAKPCNPRELLARVRSVLRRQSSSATKDADAEGFQYIFGNFFLDGNTHKLFWKEMSIPINHKEFLLLKTLIQNKGKPLSRTQLSARIYGKEHEPDQRDIDMIVSRLRKHLSTGHHTNDYIETVRGIGYMFQCSDNC